MRVNLALLGYSEDQPFNVVIARSEKSAKALIEAVEGFIPDIVLCQVGQQTQFLCRDVDAEEVVRKVFLMVSSSGPQQLWLPLSVEQAKSHLLKVMPMSDDWGFEDQRLLLRINQYWKSPQFNCGFLLIFLHNYFLSSLSTLK